MTRRAGALATVALVVLAAGAAAQSPPPVPRDFVTDEAGVLPADAKARLEGALRRFDEETSNQVLVVIYRKLPSASLEDFTVRTAQAWRAGRGKLDNGVVLFVFVEDRKVRLEVGYGLEGALPDVTAHRIIDEQITPRFRAGDYAGGLEAGVAAIVAATRGEYTASPRPVAGGGGSGIRIGAFEIFVIVMVLLLVLGGGGGGGRTYGRRGYRRGGFFPFPIIVGGGRGGWGGGGFGGGGGGFGGGGFSGGGGSFGGGGASGSW